VSLFEDNRFVYRDTFFVYYKKQDRPNVENVKAFLAEMGNKYQTTNLKDSDGKFESMTIHSPQDYSAMDVTYLEGEEVVEQVSEMMKDFILMTLTGEDQQKLKIFQNCDARFDVFHFEQIAEGRKKMKFLILGACCW